MLSYEICKRLKEAGFPQLISDSDGDWSCTGPNARIRLEYRDVYGE